VPGFPPARTGCFAGAADGLLKVASGQLFCSHRDDHLQATAHQPRYGPVYRSARLLPLKVVMVVIRTPDGATAEYRLRRTTDGLRLDSGAPRTTW
jgi:hypothetical protein